MFCSVCGAQNSDQVRFCRSCGKPLSASNNLSGEGGEDPYKTRLAIPIEQASVKQQTPAANSGAPDPFATMVGMPVAKASPPPPTTQPDPFATQVGGAAFNPAQLKELAAKANNQASAPTPNSSASSDIDMMKTVVGGMPGLPPQPQQNQGIDMMKTVGGGVPAVPRAPQGPDPLATVVGMPAITPLPKPEKKDQKDQKAQEKKPADKPAAQVKSANTPPVSAPPALPEPKATPMNYAQESKGSSMGLYIGIAAVAIIIIVVAIVFMKK